MRQAQRKKEKGWPSMCQKCKLWMPITCVCKARNEEGTTPCYVMSKKAFDYLCKQSEED